MKDGLPSCFNRFWGMSLHVSKGRVPRAIDESFFSAGNISSFNQQNLEDSLGSKEPSPEFHST